MQGPIGSVVDETKGIGGAGDLNGDGFNDLFMAMRIGADLTEASLLVFHGASTGVSTTPSTIIESVVLPPSWFAFSISGSGDVNGDGFGDLMTSTRVPGVAYLFHGSASF